MKDQRGWRWEGERQAIRIREVVVVDQEGLYPGNSRKSQNDFKQGTSMLELSYLKDHLGSVCQTDYQASEGDGT